MKYQAILTPVREAHLFDQNALSDYLKAHLSGFKTPLKVEQFEGGQSNIREQVAGLQAGGDTSLYDAISQSITLLRNSREAKDDRIQSIVVLSDGQDTSSLTALQSVVELIKTSRNDRNPVIVIPVAYGGDADINALNGIARASATRVQSGDPDNIQNVLEIISSYF